MAYVTYLKDKVYDVIPDIKGCQMCGKCCVSVTLTMVEFVFLFDAVSKKYSSTHLLAILNQPSKRSQFLPENYSCKFVGEDGACLAYEGRGFSCRFGGNPVLDTVYRGNCLSSKREVIGDDVPFSEYRRLMQTLEVIDVEMRGFNTTLFLSRISLESWLSIFVSSDIAHIEIRKIQAVLRNYLDVSVLLDRYEDTVHFSRKVDKIMQSRSLFQKRHFSEALQVLEEFIADNIDGYYLDEAMYYAGKCCEALGNLQQAYTWYEPVSAFHPFYTNARNRCDDICMQLLRRGTKQKNVSV